MNSGGGLAARTCLLSIFSLRPQTASVRSPDSAELQKTIWPLTAVFKQILNWGQSESGLSSVAM